MDLGFTASAANAEATDINSTPATIILVFNIPSPHVRALRPVDFVTVRPLSSCAIPGRARLIMYKKMKRIAIGAGLIWWGVLMGCQKWWVILMS